MLGRINITMKNILKINLTVLFIFVISSTYCQNTSLSIFKPFANIQWVGHYVNSSDSTLNHYIKWEFSLDSSYVIQTKEVPELSFKMETYFYWDYELNQISTLSLLNRDMISKGRIELNNKKLEIYCRTFYPGGNRDSKQTWQINENGEVKDYFYKHESNEWIQGHLIIYERTETLPIINKHH